MAIKGEIKFGLNVNRNLADVVDNREALANLGVDINDLDVIRGAAGELGITADDIRSLSGLNVNLQKYLVKLYQDTQQYTGIIDDTAGTTETLKGNLTVNGSLGASSIKYLYLDDDNQTLKFADISTSRVSSWSSTDSPSTDTSPIFYGGEVEVDGSVTANSIEITKSADAVRFRDSEVPTHKIQATINGETVYLYAMKGIPLIFEGFFRDLDSDLRLLSSGAVSWRIVNLEDSFLTREYENVGGTNTTRSFLRFRDTRSSQKNIEIYHNPDNITQLPLRNIGISKLPNAQLNNLQNLFLDRNIIKDFPDFTVFSPNLRLLDLRENNFTLGDNTDLRKFNDNVLARIPTSLTELRMGNTFVGSITADLTQLTNLITLNLSSHSRGGARNVFDRDAEDPTGSLPEVAETVQNYFANYNSFDSLPASVKQLPELRNFQIYSNQISDDNFFIDSENINFVNIGNNSGINVPDLSNKSSLAQFYSHYNRSVVTADPHLFTTPSGGYKFTDCASLTRIYAIGGRYTGPIPRFAGNTALNYVEARSTRLQGGKSDAEQEYVLYPDVFDDCADSMRTFRVSSTNLLDAPIHPEAFVKTTGMSGIEFRSFGRGVSGNIPLLDSMQNLRYLLLLQNKLTGAVPNFSNNPILYYVHLYANQLSGTIPNIDSNGLLYLYLHRNQLEIFNGLTTPNLRRLFISFNQITGTIPNMSNLERCYDLYINNNQFSDYTPGAIVGMRSLRAFDVSNNPNLPAGAVNRIVADLIENYESNPRGGVSVNLRGTAPITGEAVEQVDFLRSVGWNMRT